MTRMKSKTILCISALLVASLCLTSCGKDMTYPDYLLEGARDNGFVPAYRAYFAIDSNNVTKISKRKYDNFVYHDKIDHYDTIPEIYYSFVAHNSTIGSPPSEWEYTQSKYDNIVYDIEILKKYLSMMDLQNNTLPAGFEDPRIEIVIIEFDDYNIIEVTQLNEFNMVLAQKYAVFHNEEMLLIPDDMDLSSIRDIYKYKTDE